MNIPKAIKELQDIMYRVALFTDGKIDTIKYYSTSKLLSEILESFKNNNGLENIDLVGEFCNSVFYYEMSEPDFKEDDDSYNQQNENALHTYIETWDGCNKIHFWLKENYPEKYIDESDEDKASNMFKPENNSIDHSKKTKKTKTSYVWQGSTDELTQLHQLMINEYKLIAPETTHDQLRAVFTDQPVDNIEPIKWHQENATELLYFIIRLEESSNIEHIGRTDYQKLEACFVNPDGNQFNVVWKALKYNIKINLSPDKQKAIDDLIGNF